MVMTGRSVHLTTLFNMHAQLTNRDRSNRKDQQVYLLPYSMYASSKGSDQPVYPAKHQVHLGICYSLLSILRSHKLFVG